MGPTREDGNENPFGRNSMSYRDQQQSGQLPQHDPIEFIDGMYAKDRTKDGVALPNFIVAKLSIKREDLIAYLESKDGEWLNIDILRKKNGSGIYAKLDDWEPTPRQAPPPPVEGDDFEDDIPF